MKYPVFALLLALVIVGCSKEVNPAAPPTPLDATTYNVTFRVQSNTNCGISWGATDAQGFQSDQYLPSTGNAWEHKDVFKKGVMLVLWVTPVGDGSHTYLFILVDDSVRASVKGSYASGQSPILLEYQF